MDGDQAGKLRTSYIDYDDGDTVFEAYAAFDPSDRSKRPCVLVAPAWDGLNEPIRAKVEAMARAGYVGIAIDVYGKGVRGGVLDDNSHLMAPLLEDRALLQRRLLAAFEVARRHPYVDPDRIAAIGYCFGGLCVLDLARADPDGLAGVVSLHGVLTPPNIGPQAPIRAKLLILHGWRDPGAPPQDVLAIGRELTDAGADWQLHAYGRAMHAFTFPGAQFPERGLLYDEAADKRSSTSTRLFLEEIFARPAD